jgi:hypothetical protein
MSVKSTSGRLEFTDHLIRDGRHIWSYGGFGWTTKRLDILEPLMDEMEVYLAEIGEMFIDMGPIIEWFHQAILNHERGLPRPEMPSPWRFRHRRFPTIQGVLQGIK